MSKNLQKDLTRPPPCSHGCSHLFFFPHPCTYFTKDLKGLLFPFSARYPPPPVEALHLGTLMAAHGYFFPISDHVLTLKDDGTFYRFQVRAVRTHFIIITGSRPQVTLYIRPRGRWRCESPCEASAQDGRFVCTLLKLRQILSGCAELKHRVPSFSSDSILLAIKLLGTRKHRLW